MSSKGDRKISPEKTFRIEPFFELSADLFCIAGFDGYFKLVNPAVSKLLGYTNKELYARPVNDFIYTEDQQITEGWRNSLRDNNPLLNFENRYVTKSGNIVWLSWTSMPLKDEELVYAIAKDITHKKKLEEERNKQLKFLIEANSHLKKLMYTTSHDLRSPVNSLQLILSLLETSNITDTETLELLDLLKAGTDNLKNVLNDQVDVLIKKQDLAVEVKEVNLPECLNKVLLSISSLIADSHTIIETDFSQADTVRFNPASMESVFLNLITNAIKYARPGCPPVISVFSTIVKGRKQLVFADNGLGFDMGKVKDRIFKINQKFHDRDDSKGLGLHLVYSHVTALGGNIDVESQVNQGSKFIITFE